MKIKICIGEDAYNGYINLSPIQGDGYTLGNPTNLDGVAVDNECHEILAPRVLDYIGGYELLPTIQHYVKKLRHKGIIILGGTDAFAICRDVFQGSKTMVDFNKTVFGDGGHPWSFKKGLYTINDIVPILQQLGLTIINKRINAGIFSIEAMRE